MTKPHTPVRTTLTDYYAEDTRIDPADIEAFAAPYMDNPAELQHAAARRLIHTLLTGTDAQSLRAHTLLNEQYPDILPPTTPSKKR